MKAQIFNFHCYTRNTFLKQFSYRFFTLVIALTGLSLYAQNSSKLKVVKEADSLFRWDNYKAALTKYESSFKAGNTYCDDYYNAARCAAILKNSVLAIKYLKLSIQNGFVDEDFVSNDYYFHSLNMLKLAPTLKPLFKSQRMKIETALLGIKKVPCQRLIPFYRKGLWGYMDAKDTSVVVKPLFIKTDFMYENTWICYKNQTGIQISQEGKILDMYTHLDFDEFEAMDIGGEGLFEKVSAVNGYKGFTHRDGAILKHSDLYSKMERYTLVIKKKHYAIAYIGKLVALIDEEGQTLKGFDFSDSLIQLHKAYDSRDTLVWLWFKDSKNGTGYKNENGVTAFYNVFVFYPEFTPNKVRNYTFDSTRQGTYGVFDYWNLKWVIQPQEYEIVDVHLHRKQCDIVVNYDQTKTLYYLIKTPEGDMYYRDEFMNEYRIKF